MTTLLLRAIATVREWLGLNDARDRQLELALVPVPVSSDSSRRS